MQSPRWTDNSRGVGIASMFASGLVLAIGFVLEVPLSFLLGYMVVATTFVLIAWRCSVRAYNAAITAKGTCQSDSLNPYEPPADELSV